MRRLFAPSLSHTHGRAAAPLALLPCCRSAALRCASLRCGCLLLWLLPLPLLLLHTWIRRLMPRWRIHCRWAERATRPGTGENRADLRHAPDLQVSVPKLRRAFRWLSVNSWPFMEATRDHALWESGSLERSLEELLQAYVQIRRRGRMIGPDQGDTFCFLAHTACQAGCRAPFECLFAWAS